MTNDKGEIIKKTLIGQIWATFGYRSNIPTAIAQTEKLVIVNIVLEFILCIWAKFHLESLR